jgi:hypothetical protein
MMSIYPRWKSRRCFCFARLRTSSDKRMHFFSAEICTKLHTLGTSTVPCIDRPSWLFYLTELSSWVPRFRLYLKAPCMCFLRCGCSYTTTILFIVTLSLPINLDHHLLFFFDSVWCNAFDFIQYLLSSDSRSRFESCDRFAWHMFQ